MAEAEGGDELDSGPESLDGEIGGPQQVDVGGNDQGSDPLTGRIGLPPDEPASGGALVPAAAGGGGKGGSLDGGVEDAQQSSMIRGSMPFLAPEFDPIVYWFCNVDSRMKQHEVGYRNLTRSEAVAHYLTRLAFEDFENKIRTGQLNGLLGTVGDSFMRVMRVVAENSRESIYEHAREDVMSTLVQRGISTQARLEEVLGVAGSGIS